MPPYGDYAQHDVQSVLLQMREYFAQQGKPLVLRAVTEELRVMLEQSCPGMFEFEEERDLEDYLYNGADLRELKGRKYHSKFLVDRTVQPIN